MPEMNPLLLLGGLGLHPVAHHLLLVHADAVRFPAAQGDFADFQTALAEVPVFHAGHFIG